VKRDTAHKAVVRFGGMRDGAIRLDEPYSVSGQKVGGGRRGSYMNHSLLRYVFSL